MKTLMQIRNGLPQKHNKKRKLEPSLLTSLDLLKETDSSPMNRRGESTRKKVIHNEELDECYLSGFLKKSDRSSDCSNKRINLKDSTDKQSRIGDSLEWPYKISDFVKKRKKISDFSKKQDKIHGSSKKQKTSDFSKKHCNDLKANQLLATTSGDIENESLQPQNSKRRRKLKRKKDKLVLDEASQLQRRARYLLVKLNLEQTLIDAYSGEGWKGQSREKLKPEKELQRAKKQILKCKLGIRDTVRQLDLLGSVGQIDDSLILPDGSVHHEHIVCKRCKSQEVSEDNDIILCDGTCNCAFHQKCLDPPLATADIPPEDEGWLCKYCDCKFEILDAVNAHLGTQFSADSPWQDIFKEEALLSDDGTKDLNLEEWPDDESDDNDYDPEGNDSNSTSRYAAGDDSASHEESSTSSSSCSVESEAHKGTEFLAERNEISSNIPPLLQNCVPDSNGVEIVSGPRQRSAVDYKKLYDEMFAKDTCKNDTFSEDEDWDPCKRRRTEKESDAANTLMTLCESEIKHSDSRTIETGQNHTLDKKARKPLSRIPCEALQKLHQAFAENELPSRAVKKQISELVGLEFQKVNKWFKNARYLALKSRKRGKGSLQSEDKLHSELNRKVETISSPTSAGAKKQLKRVSWNCSLTRLISPSKRQQVKRSSLGISKANLELRDDMSLKKHLSYLKAKSKHKSREKCNPVHDQTQNAEMLMEQLWQLEARLWKSKFVLSSIQKSMNDESNEQNLEEKHFVYVPFVNLNEKA